jgi:hypothetical protein
MDGRSRIIHESVSTLIHLADMHADRNLMYNEFKKFGHSDLKNSPTTDSYVRNVVAKIFTDHAYETCQHFITDKNDLEQILKRYERIKSDQEDKLSTYKGYDFLVSGNKMSEKEINLTTPNGDYKINLVNYIEGEKIWDFMMEKVPKVPEYFGKKVVKHFNTCQEPIGQLLEGEDGKKFFDGSFGLYRV